MKIFVFIIDLFQLFKKKLFFYQKKKYFTQKSKQSITFLFNKFLRSIFIIFYFKLQSTTDDYNF